MWGGEIARVLKTREPGCVAQSHVDERLDGTSKCRPTWRLELLRTHRIATRRRLPVLALCPLRSRIGRQ